MFCAVHKRQLKGAQRKQYATAAEHSSPAYVHRARMADMNTTSLAAGNLSDPQTPAVIAKALFDARQQRRLADDPQQELVLVKDTLRCSMGDIIPGFVQGLGHDPFWVLMYGQGQVEFFRDECQRGSAVVHVDCTGSVMKQVPGQKRPYYYALVMSKHSMGVCEFMTTCHHQAWIMSVIDMFLAHVASVNAGMRRCTLCTYVIS